MERCGTLVPCSCSCSRFRCGLLDTLYVLYLARLALVSFLFFLFPLQADSLWNYLEKYACLGVMYNYILFVLIAFQPGRTGDYGHNGRLAAYKGYFGD
jgi:hypothetical protein